MVACRVEWQTVLVAAAIAAAVGTILAVHEQLPVVVVVGALGVVGAWYNSLQHEVIHGHPTPWRWCNTAFAVVPLGLVVSLGTYRDHHLAHHRSEALTDPDGDPESFYTTAAGWERSGPSRRAVLLAMQTVAGRLVLGPPVAAVRWLRIEVTAARHTRGAVRLAGHAGAVAAVLAVVQASGMDLWVFVVGVTWVGGGLSLLRSFAEHRMVDDGTRSAVVRAGRMFSLLYLNNNLHHTHHAYPRVPWFELPAVNERLGADQLAAAGAGLYRGYADVVRRYLFRPFDGVVHPAGATSRNRTS